MDRTPEDAEPPTTREAARTMVPDLVLAAVAGGIGAAVPGAAGNILSAGVPALLKLAHSLDLAALRRREARAEQTLRVSAEALGVEEDPAALEDLLTADEQRTDLTAAVLRAAAATVTAEEKVDALGRVLAYGVQRGDQFDPAVALAAALRDVERPHVAALRHLAQGYRQALSRNQRGDVGRWSPPLLKVHSSEELVPVAGGPLTLPGVMATLTRHGLARLEPLREQYADPRDGWLLTELGQLFLHMLDPENYPPTLGADGSVGGTPGRIPE